MKCCVREFLIPVKHQEDSSVDVYMNKGKSSFLWKEILNEYYPYTLLQFGFIALVDIKFISNYYLVFYKIGSEVSLVIAIVYFGALTMVIGILIRYLKPKFKIVGGLMVITGVIVQVFSINKLNPSLLIYKSAILFLSTTAIVSAWSVILFFLFDKETMAEIKARSRRKGGAYYALAVGILTFISSIFLNRYIGGQINALMVGGSDNRADDLSATQVMALIDAKVSQADVMQAILLIVISIVFILPYRKWVIGSDKHHQYDL